MVSTARASAGIGGVERVGMAEHSRSLRWAIACCGFFPKLFIRGIGEALHAQMH
jgi:hypothetical protein